MLPPVDSGALHATSEEITAYNKGAKVAAAGHTFMHGVQEQQSVLTINPLIIPLTTPLTTPLNTPLNILLITCAV